MRKTRMAIVTAGAVGALLTTAAHAPTVSADTDSTQVAAGANYIGLFQNENLGGSARYLSSSVTEFSGQRWGNGQPLQNSASSMYNASDRYVGLWDIGTSCTGASYVAKPRSEDSTFVNNGFNDRASCLKFL